MRDVSPMEETLKSIAIRLEAVGIALYETGRTLPRTGEAPDWDSNRWTGQAYLVSAWAAVDDRDRQERRIIGHSRCEFRHTGDDLV